MIGAARLPAIILVITGGISGSFLRGLKYYYDDLVMDLQVNEEKNTLEIDATVSGTYVYGQEIDISFGNYGATIEGHCSCPVGYNCKHVVAVIYKLKYEYGANKSIKVATKAPEDKWLDSLMSLQKKEKINLVPENDNFLIYRLFMADYGENELNFYKAKILKNGSLSKGTKLSNENYLYRYNYSYEYVNVLDKELAALFNDFSHGYSRDITFRDEYGAIMLKKTVKSGRCFFKDSSTPLRYSSEKKMLEFVWQEKDDLSWLSSNLSDDEFLFSSTTPPLCVDIKNNTLYEVESTYEKEMLKLMLKAPKLSTEKATQLVQKVLHDAPDITFPVPKSFEIEEIECVPVPHLYVYGEKIQSDKRTHLMQLSFEYEGEYFENYLEGSSHIVSRDGKTLRIKRDLGKEESYRGQIESLGFTYNDHPLIKAYTSTVTTTMQDAIERWRVFREDVIPKLQEEGWQIEIDESFKYNFEYAETISLEVTQESEVNDWFEVSFGVDIGGKKLELLPIVAPLLQEFDTVDDLPEHLNLEIREGVYLHIESKEIKPILNTIFELFDKQEGDKLIIRP